MAETTTLKTLREAIAGELGILNNVTITVDADPNFTIPDVLDKAPDPERWRDAYLYQSAEWRRIVSVNDTTQVVTVTRTSGITAGAAQIYMMVDPDDLNAAINEGLKELYYEERDTISLVADTKVYTLPSWVQQKGQLLDIRWRDISALTTRPQERSIGSYSVRQDANALTLYINEALLSPTTYDIQVVGRRNYSALASDAATTTCPYQLALWVGAVKVLHRISQKWGKGVMSLFGPKMVIAEREMAKAKMDWLPRLTAVEYVQEETWEGVDGNPSFEYPTW